MNALTHVRAGLVLVGISQAQPPSEHALPQTVEDFSYHAAPDPIHTCNLNAASRLRHKKMGSADLEERCHFPPPRIETFNQTLKFAPAILRMVAIDDTRLTYKYQGHRFRLMDVRGAVRNKGIGFEQSRDLRHCLHSERRKISSVARKDILRSEPA